jgi:peptidoglycan/LPS O-acetylase OafA/YrhL
MIAFFTNFSLFGSDWLHFLNTSESGFSFIGSPGLGDASKFLLIAPAWTLGLEMTFYLFAPKLVALSRNSILLFVIFFLALRVTFWSLGYSQDPWSYRFIIFELPIFFLGIFVEKFKTSKIELYKISNTAAYLMIVIFYFVIGILIHYVTSDYIWLLTMVLLFSILILLFSGESERDRKIGELSYPLYLSHILTITCTAVLLEKLRFFENAHSRGVFEFIVVLLALLIAKLIVMITAPLERIRDGLRERR